MEKKNFIFKAFDSKGKEINLKFSNVFYDITEEMAEGIRIGWECGLYQKYENPRVICSEATEEELREYEERLYKALDL